MVVNGFRFIMVECLRYDGFEMVKRVRFWVGYYNDIIFVVL